MELNNLFKNQQEVPQEVEERLKKLEQQKEERKESSEVGTKLPVKRDYDFDSMKPSDLPEYMEHDNELTRILADLKHRENSGSMPRYLIGGPTGAGKTHLARAVAKERGCPIFTIQGKYSMDEADLLGTPMLIDGQTVWSDGPLTKALLASQEGEVVLLMDELNRAPPESKGILFSVLDDRCRVELDARGGEVIEGKPENLIVIGTMNEGTDYETQPLDLAEKRRFGTRWDIDHLGKNHPEKEAEIIYTRTPAPEPVAERMVKIANKLRDKSVMDTSVVPRGVPTANLISWARLAYSYKEEGVQNTIVEAAEDALTKPLYDGRKERQEVLEVIKDYADGAPFEEEGFKNWIEEESTR